jgi:hypothetical protein
VTDAPNDGQLDESEPELASESDAVDREVDSEGAPHPSFGRSLGLFWLYTFLRFGLFGGLWLVLWLLGLGSLIAAAISLLLSIPLSLVLLARPRRALAANIEQRVNAHVDRRADFDARLDGEEDDDVTNHQ